MKTYEVTLTFSAGMPSVVRFRIDTSNEENARASVKQVIGDNPNVVGLTVERVEFPREEDAHLAINRMLNNMSFEQGNFVDLMNKEHRTIQQAFTGLCLAWLKNAARPDYGCDFRNSASHDACRAIVETSEYDWRYTTFPLV